LKELSGCQIWRPEWVLEEGELEEGVMEEGVMEEGQMEGER
jgi:hypothetical protein